MAYENGTTAELSTLLSGPPGPDEAAAYHFRYIERVPDGDIREVLAAQLDDTLTLLGRISEEASRARYAPDKWSIRQVLAHINDCERLFTFRAFWFARGLDAPLPGFDQDVAAAHVPADTRPWGDLLNEFREIRSATLSLFRPLLAEHWVRSGRVDDYQVSVRALAYITAGHVLHHRAVLAEHYGVAAD
ncbi:DinB family protein [soil metagenome]